MDAYSSVKLKAKENNYSISKVELDQLLSSNVITQAEYNELVALSN